MTAHVRPAAWFKPRKPLPSAAVLGMVLLTALGLFPPVHAQDAPRKVAFLVGVAKYDKAGLTDLTYPESDVKALKTELERTGFTVRIMLGSGQGSERATRENLRRELEEKFIRALGKLNKDDIVLIMLAGHGRELEVSQGEEQTAALATEPFFCPADAQKSDPSTMLSISGLMDQIAERSGSENNLLVIDACRDDPSRGGRGIDGSRVTIPTSNLAVLFGSSAGTRSFESDKLKAGLLTYYLLEGLRGKARDADGEITWSGLTTYATKQVIRNAPEIVGALQRPNGISNLVTVPVLVRSVPRDATPQTSDSDPPRQFTNSIAMKFTLIPAGEFLMGSPRTEAGREDYEYQHRVRITQPFYLGTYEVTLGQFLKFCKDTGHKIDAIKDGKGGWGWTGTTFEQQRKFVPWSWGFEGQTNQHPVVNVSWNDAVAFCAWLSKKEGKTYRLPTEAEWEYACRAGSTGRFFFGDDPEQSPAWANVADPTLKEEWSELTVRIESRDGFAFTAPVGSFRPNAFGLYDMAGNVYEWCQDWFHQDYYATSPSADPQGPTSGSSRVIRGGGWYGGTVRGRSAYRDNAEPAFRSYGVGFRVAVEP